MLGRTWDFLRRWPYTFGAALALVVGIFTLIMSSHLGVPLRDPEGFLGPAYVRLPLMALAFFAVGVIPMAIKRRGIKKIVPGIADVIRYEWTWGRVVHIASGLLVFYVCYVCYRNLKSYLPVLREGVLYDRMFAEWDYWVTFGHQPGELLHQLLGTGFNAQVLSFIYLTYLMLIPITLGAFLVLNRDVSLGAWYATALALNWILGTVSYYIWPSLGPAFFQPQFFTDLEESGVTALQQSLFRNASAFKEDPSGQFIYGIAGFASLHVSVTFTAALFFQRTDQSRFIQALGWVYFALTVLATIYFGWHYLADDVGGILIGWLSVAIGGWATGNGFWRQRHHKIQLTADPDDSRGTVSKAN
ncbi:beta-carotene 15,15'-monooxygenase [Aeromicrobium sp. PE09-221]|uniref:phosphatase PAP2 family protein n=1 Tax=Aeromicrobium sp. PE09-221 TaxID=1898043 RepID=UPI000B6C3E03|nr:phosphatase PAP2 family protein [Aeromicrobium sp. PE09-221]OUZ09429.1 beta-carotene 15,15'-monooxygenase [Aeromicrobium sp. PE09-221]